MRTANPALNDRTFVQFGRATDRIDAMTLEGAVNKTALLLLMCVVPAGFVWQRFYAAVNAGAPPEVGGWMIAGVLSGLVFALATIFKPTWSPVSGPLYAMAEGLFLGGLSARLELLYPGIVIQAIGLTFGTLFALLLAYKSGMIKPSENFRLGLVAAMGGIALVYLATIVLGFFGMTIPYIHGSGVIGIGFSMFVVVIAALNLVLDFDFIENGAASGAPKYMEWYAAFGLLVTLVWLYVEILRLLVKLQGGNRD